MAIAIAITVFVLFLLMRRARKKVNELEEGGSTNVTVLLQRPAAFTPRPKRRLGR